MQMHMQICICKCICKKACNVLSRGGRAGHWELYPECSSHRPEAAGLEAIPPSYCLSPHFLASIKEEIRVVRKPLCISLSGSDFSCKGVS